MRHPLKIEYKTPVIPEDFWEEVEEIKIESNNVFVSKIDSSNLEFIDTNRSDQSIPINKITYIKLEI